jgi:PKHD-type hydroxylase
MKPPYWIWDSKLSKTICETLMEESNNFSLPKEGVIDKDTLNTNIRKTIIRWAPLNHWIEGILFNHALWANNNAKWNFDVRYPQAVQIGKYDKDSHYDWHEDWFPLDDSGEDLRKISVVCLLNDPSEFTGGEFQFKLGRAEETVELKQGTIIAFPSFILHRIKPVTSGMRVSAVCWVVGDHTL